MKRTIATLVAAFMCVPVLATYEAHVTFSDECPVTGSPTGRAESMLAAVGVGIATQLARGVIDHSVDALISALKPTARSLSATTNQDAFYAGSKVSPEIMCMIVAVGGRQTSLKEAVVPAFDPKFGAIARAGENVRDKFKFTEEPAFYLEATILSSSDGSAFSWSPRYLKLNRFINTQFLAGGSRDITLTVRTKDLSQTVFYEFAINLVDATTVIEKGADQLRAQTGPWGVPPAAKASHLSDSSMRHVPFTASAVYVETPRPSKIASLLVGSVESHTAQLKAAIKQAIVPEDRRVAVVAAEASNRKIVSDYLSALTSYEKDCAAPITTSSAFVRCEIQYFDLSRTLPLVLDATERIGVAIEPQTLSPSKPRRA